MAGQLVGGIRVDRRPLTRFFHHDVLDPALALDGDEHVLAVQFDRGRDAGVDGVLQAGNLQEPATLSGGVLAVTGVLLGGAACQFQGVKNLLPGGLDHGQRVAVRMDFDQVAIGDRSLLQGSADAATIDEGDIGVGNRAVGIGAQVAKVGLTSTDQTHAVRIGNRQVDIGLADDLRKALLVLRLDRVDERCDIGILVRICSDQSRLHHPIRSDQEHADIGELRPGRGKQDFPAILGGDHFAGNDTVGMAVKHHIDTGRIGNQVGGAERGGRLVSTQVGKHDDILGPLGTGLVDILLDDAIKSLRVVTIKIVGELIPFLEIGRSGLGDALRSGNANETHLEGVIGRDLVGLHVSEQVSLASRVLDITGQILAIGLADQLGKTVHAIVELMVADGGIVISDLVHDFHRVLALGNGPHRLALDGIAIIHQDHIRCFFQHLLFQGHQRLVPERGTNRAVHIVGVQHHDAVLLLGDRLREQGTKSDKQYQQYIPEFFHQLPPFVVKLFLE